MRAEEQVPRAGGHATTRVDESARQAAPAATLPLPSPPTALSAPRTPPPPSVRDAQEAASAESGIRARRQGDADARVAAAAPGPTPFPAAPAPQRENAQSARGAGPGADALASAASPPLAATWLAAADPSAWRRRAPGGDEAALRAGWLAQLVAVTQGRWTAIPVGAATQGETWTLLHPGGLRGRVILLAAAVIVCDAQGARCEQAPLGETALGSLREALLR